MCACLSVSYQIIFMTENRMLLAVSLVVVRPLLQFTFELLGYLYAGRGLASNYPTNLASVASYLLVVLWIQWLNHGGRILGILNRTVFKLDGGFDFRHLLTLKYWMHFVRYLFGFLNFISFLITPAAVILGCTYVLSTYSQ